MSRLGLLTFQHWILVMKRIRVPVACTSGPDAKFLRDVARTCQKDFILQICVRCPRKMITTSQSPQQTYCLQCHLSCLCFLAIHIHSWGFSGAVTCLGWTDQSLLCVALCSPTNTNWAPSHMSQRPEFLMKLWPRNSADVKAARQ